MLCNNPHKTAVFVKTFCMRIQVFYSVTPHQMINSYWCLGGAYRIHLQGLGVQEKYYIQILFLDLHFLKEEVVQPSEFQVTIFHSTWHYIPGGMEIHQHHCKKLRSHIWWKVLKKTAALKTVATCIILGFHSNVSKVSVLLGYDTASLGIWFPVFWNNIVVSSSRMEMYMKNAGEQVNAWI
jgi:hypothetical protein